MDSTYLSALQGGQVGLARTIHLRVYTVLFAGKSPDILSYSVYIYGFGQPLFKVSFTGVQVHGLQGIKWRF